MTVEKGSPCGCGELHGPYAEPHYSGILHDRFPECKLFGTAFVDHLPASCPMAEAQPLAAIQAVRDRAYERLAPGPHQDATGGINDLARAESCTACLARFSAHPTVRRLRLEALGNAGPGVHPSAETMTAGDSSSSTVIAVHRLPRRRRVGQR